MDESSFLASVGLDPAGSSDGADHQRPAFAITDPKTMVPTLVMAILFTGIVFWVLGVF